MEKRILELITSHGTLVTPEVVDYITAKADPETYIKNTMKQLTEAPLYLTIDILKTAEMDIENKSTQRTSMPNLTNNPVNLKTLSNNINNLSSNQPSVIHDNTKEFNLAAIAPTTKSIKVKPEISLPMSSIQVSRKPIATEIEENIEIIKDVTGQSTSEGVLKDFIKCFRERFNKIRKLLQTQRREVMGAVDIAKARGRQGPVKVIGMINSVRPTKQGHRILEIEDETDNISIFINNSSPLINMAFVKDEIICVIGKIEKSDLIYTDDIIRPDIPITRQPTRAKEPVACLFISDIHVGSNTFLNRSWDRFINWLNGKYTISSKDVLWNKIKYIIVSGDIVDGIGIYPNQESELEISDIYAQYECLAKKFQNIPEHIRIIIQPGNHDAVRPAEPQPTFPMEITKLFNNNMKFIGNPCYFKLHGVEILSYHGRSMDDFVMQIPGMSYNKPIAIMKEMLVRRHLAPVYGERTPIAPEHLDYLVIDRIPDIFVTGHIHKTAVDNYRDILLINASSWQAQTKYQKMMNFNPDPGKAILADLQSGGVQILNF